MQKLKLLLLEDDDMDADLIRIILERSGIGFEITIVSDKKEFLLALNNSQFDIILADNSLPQFNAVNALQLVRELNLHIPFILVTGTVSEDYAVNVMKEGASDYILKDRLQRLPSAIKSAISKHALELQQQKHVEDITKKEALMKESERLACLGSWDSDLIHNTTRWSDENYRILDYLPGEVEPSLSSFLKRVHPDDVEAVRQTLETTVDHLSKQKFSCRIVFKDGSIRNLENEVFITRNNAGKAIRINGISRDITETVLTGEMLQRSEANLRTIFNNTDVGYILLDTSYNIVSFNQHVSEFFIGETGKPLVERANITGYFFADNRERILDALTDAVTGKTINYEVPYHQSDGSNKWFYVTYHPVWNHRKEVLGVIMSQTDITKRKNLELQERKITADLIQRNNDLEQFTYIVSHNLRGPVATILGISDVIKDETLDETEKKVFIDGLIGSVKKLDDVIMDLNNIIRSKNTVNDKKEKVDFRQLLVEVTAGIQNVTNGAPANIKSDFSEVESMVTLKSYMYSIFYNLISNSIKYRQHDVAPVIEIKSRKINDKIELLFKDNGLGIDLKKKGDQIFGLYKRFHMESAEGKGMGLFMVKTQVETLGGRISVESEVNVGTQFKIEFELPEASDFF